MLRSVIALATTLLLLVLHLAAPALADEGAPASFADAAKAFEEGRLADCVALCERVPADASERRRAVFLRAESQLRLGQADAAQADFEAVLAENPKSVPAMVGLGRALQAQGRNDVAEETLRAAVKRDKKSAYAYRALGELFVSTRKFSDARTALARSWKLDPKDPLTTIALVDMHLGYKDAAGAIKVSKQLIKARPKHPVGHFLLGRALEHDREWKDAVIAYEQAIECDPEYLDAHKNLAIVCQTQNAMYRDRALLDKSMQHYARYFELGGQEPELRRIYDQMVAFLKWQAESNDE